MNIFDQFEQAPDKSKSNNLVNVEVSTSGYIQMSMEQEQPIFTKSKKDFTPADKITHVAISNKYLVIAMSNHMLFRMNLNQPTQQDEISLTRYKDNSKLTNMFLDPYGNHLLLTFIPEAQQQQRPKQAVGPDLVYISRKSPKLKSTTKFRGHEITAVAWNQLNQSEITTGPILLGTSKGLIFETEIALDGDKFFTTSLEQYWRQVFDIGKGNSCPITGLVFYSTSNTENRYLIFATTNNRIYVFFGNTNSDDRPLLQQVFNRYLNIPEQDTFVRIDTQLNYSQIRFWSESLVLAPHSFTWMTGKGLYFAQFDPNSNDIVKHLKNNMQLIEYTNSSTYPFSLTITEFHVLLAYKNAIHGICLLNSDLIYEDDYNEAFGTLTDIVKDTITGTIWAVTETALFRYKVNKEERNVWHIYCEKGNFDLAKFYARDNEAYYNQVLIKEANVLFEEGKFDLSAERYAETQSRFEEICLKFIEADEEGSLKIFLRKKLEKLKPQDKTQITMIVIWLVELYLNQLEEMRLEDKSQTNVYFTLQKEFEQFLDLPKVAENIRDNKSSIYDLMASHGDKTNTIRLTRAHKDFEQLIRKHIYKNNFHEALEVLKSQDNRDLFYKFAPILIQEKPEHVVKALIAQGRYLMPDKLLPALVSCDGQSHSLEIIKYLEYCVNSLRCSEKAIHNLLLSLYAKYDTKKLMDYLNTQGQDILMVNYDVHFALRLCQEKKLTQACVLLSGILGLWETAVDMALQIDTDLAKQIANQPPQDDVELRKKLWLKIAKHVVSGKDDIQNAMDFLQQCDLIKIEDILPFFSDFVTIDHFRDAICHSLKEYNQHIEDLKEEMDEATKSAELVRKEIQSFRNKSTTMSSSSVCEICELTLMMRPFYMFPCSHRFHADCLLKELNPMLGPAKRNKLADLQRQLNILNTQTIDNISTGSTGMSARDTVKAEIDNIVASECLYCGENMIRNIDLPFFDENDFDNILREWE